MPGLNFETRTGQLTLGGVAMRCPAWHIQNLRPLWLPAAVRGQDRLMPGAAGVRPNPRRRTVTVVNLTITITGKVTGPADDPAYAEVCGEDAQLAQLEANLDYLRANVLDPAGGNGTRAAVLTLPSGATRTGQVHVVEFSEQGGNATSFAANLGLSIPRGVLQ